MSLQRPVHCSAAYFADPHRNQPGEINSHDGGRGVYWADPSDNLLEIITVPYGGWPSG